MISGPDWCIKFPTSRSLDDLAPTFRPKAVNFISALKAAGASVAVNATRRPAARAYLMHWCWMIAREGYDSSVVPPLAGVDIVWNHDHAKSAAEGMVGGYNMSYVAALNSTHISGEAIDMDIHWTSDILNIYDSHNESIIVDGQRDGMNPKLWDVGQTYGVLKLKTDRPHWSLTGH